MYHHDNRDYNEAASEAARQGRIKMEEIINKGLANTQSVVERVLSTQIHDRIVKAAATNVYMADDKTWRLEIPETTVVPSLHNHAFGQIVANAGMPQQFVDHLIKQANGTAWGAALVSHNLKEIFSHRPTQRNLIRSEDGIVKGFLSDKFRRIDSRPLLDTFMGGAAELGLVPIEGVGLDTRTRVRAVLPKVFEPIPNEVMIFGLEWGNSDFGKGGHIVNLWSMRTWCTNLAIANSVLRQIHLGKRLDDDIEYSDETYRLDTEANRAALADAMRHAIGPAQVHKMLSSIQSANEKTIQGRDGVEKLLKSALSKTELEKVADMYEGPDVQNLPSGQTTWRLSNAVSFFAQANTINADRKLELQELAGKLAGLRTAKDAEPATAA